MKKKMKVLDKIFYYKLDDRKSKNEKVFAVVGKKKLM
jgi:hypothetical protein